ncbi:DUF1622 domain-containing protein [Actinobacillus delphinicola]|uniref:Protein of uncharacterized function (DUF1622) n=1 Tax=Actinobacillus delphinicola TaxID=51161 RepID=A0A448TSI3_9PAST|nr:DUF1622 domain-containing protein [Actinobacillus delphinicola]VEJ08952.1 Protein of uncharacterised function (DUF1622) [Actinobacillus delphinicola]
MIDENFKFVLNLCIYAIDVVSIIVLLWGVILVSQKFIRIEFTAKIRAEAVEHLMVAKTNLGTYILLSLEILICADILETILNPSYRDLIVLGAIVVIRTVISFFLNKEIESARKVHLGVHSPKDTVSE